MNLPVKMPAAVTQFAGKMFLKTKKASPEICVIGGIVFGGTAIVMTGIKTWKNKDKLSESAKAVTEARKCVKEAKEEGKPELLKQEKKELVKASKTFGKDVVKTYWIPAVMAGGAVGLIWGGRTLLRKELSAMTSAYALLMESYNKYRQRVIDDAGAEKDQEYLTGAKMVDTVDAETGEVSKRAIIKQGSGNVSPYAKWYNEGEFDSVTGEWLWRNWMWKDNPLVNEANLRSIQNAANDQLRADGYLFLNDVYKMLCLPPTREGQIVGWTLGGGDGYVDFGVFPSKKHPIEKIMPVNRLFLENKTANAFLDFNVDGPILSVLDKAFGRDYADKLVRARM